MLTPAQLAARVDHTLLKPEAGLAQIEQICREALEHGFAAVCVNPVWVETCATLIEQARSARAKPLVCSVAGFPLGASMTDVKAAEASLAVKQGALEVDMVVSLAQLIAGNREAVQRDVAAVVAAVRRSDDRAIVKVILETRALNDSQIALGCECCAAAGAAFVKTSTGFHPNGGATIEHVALLRKHSGAMKVKAAGGIRDLSTARAMLSAGADRLGMSASVAVLRELQAESA
jgi:deoxyribose-phosphate aldolase